jgi:hypothetical protein
VGKAVRSFSRRLRIEGGNIFCEFFFRQGVRNCNGVFIPASIMASRRRGGGGRGETSELLRISVLVAPTRPEFPIEF